MKSLINVEELEVEQAIEMVNKEDSTDPGDISIVANYREELDRLQEQEGEASADKGGGEDGSDSGSEGGESAAAADTTDAPPPAEGGDDTPPEETPEPTPEPTEPPEEEDKAGEDDEGGDEPEPEEAVEEPGEGPSEATMESFLIALETLDTLQKVRAYVKDTQPMGGLTREGARQVMFVTQLLGECVGISRQFSPGLALESFDDVSVREHSTQIALEGVSSFLNDIWEAVKKFFKALWTWLTDFVKGNNKTAKEKKDEAKKLYEVQEKESKALEEVATKNDADDRAKLDKFANTLYTGSARQFLWRDGEARNFGDYREGLENLVNTMVSLDLFSKRVVSKMNNLLGVLDSDKPEAQHVDSRFYESDFKGTVFLAENEGGQGRKVDGDKVILSSKILPGNKLAIFTVARDNTPVGSINPSTQQFAVMDRPINTPGVFYTTNAQDLEAIQKVHLRMLQTGEELNKSLGSIAQLITKGFGDVVNDAPKSVWANLDEQEKALALSTTQIVMGIYQRMGGSAFTKLIDLNNTATNALGRYVAANTKAMGELRASLSKK